MHKYIESIVHWYQSQLDVWGTPLVFLLMAAESSILPVPSEAVIPFAAHRAYSNPHGHLTITGVIIAGTLGSWLGATIMYWAARAAGRPLALRYGRYALISPEKIEGAERWAAHFGPMGVFISRLLPVVRHLIGIPAGIVRMDFKLYSLFTLLGSALWCCVLAWLGIEAGQNEKLMKGDYQQIVIWVGGAMLALGGVYYFFVHRHMKKRGTA